MTNYEIPNKVTNYFKKGRRKIKNVRANNDYTLTITFDNDEVRLYDMTDTINQGVFKILQDKDKFNQVYLDDSGVISWDKDSSIDSNIVWTNKLDICTDTCYIYSKPL